MGISDQDFSRDAQRALDAIESNLERLMDDIDLDLDIERQGNVLTLTFADDSKVIVNSHEAAREIWVAARSGGFHYRHDGSHWVDGRNGDELFAALSRLVSAQSGQAVRLQPG
jgi:CyaY protein